MSSSCRPKQNTSAMKWSIDSGIRIQSTEQEIYQYMIKKSEILKKVRNLSFCPFMWSVGNLADDSPDYILFPEKYFPSEF